MYLLSIFNVWYCYIKKNECSVMLALVFLFLYVIFLKSQARGSFYCFSSAIVSISIKAPIGNFATSNAVLAG